MTEVVSGLVMSTLKTIQKDVVMVSHALQTSLTKYVHNKSHDCCSFGNFFLKDFPERSSATKNCFFNKTKLFE